MVNLCKFAVNEIHDKVLWCVTQNNSVYFCVAREAKGLNTPGLDFSR